MQIIRDKCVVVSVPGSIEKTVGWGDLTSVELGIAFPVEVIIGVSSNG